MLTCMVATYNTNYRIKNNYVDIINVYIYKYYYGNVIYVINVYLDLPRE